MNEQAFVCQVLATFGKPEKSRQRYLLDKVDALDLSGLARLAAAWLASGRPDLARQCLREDALSQKIDVPATAGLPPRGGLLHDAFGPA